MHRLKSALATFNCKKRMHMFTHNCPRDIADKRNHYIGNLKSNVVSPVVLPPYTNRMELELCGDKCCTARQ